MTPYLRTFAPVRSQYRSPRRKSPTGLTVIHTAESVMDTIGPDTGAESVAAFIRHRTDPGSYHDICDADSAVQLVDYGDEAFQDGTGSNPFAMSISFALAAADWPRLTAAKRSAFLKQGARAFARQQAWLKAHGHPMTPLLRVAKAASDRGEAGFIPHGDRDPGRRTDPGADFPWAEWYGACLAAMTPPSQEDEMTDDDWTRLDKMLDDKIRLVLNGKQPDGKLTHVNNLTSIRADLAALDVPRKKA